VAAIDGAGGIIWRAGIYPRIEILLIHRPVKDDWSFPKGKLRTNESAQQAALREVREETGLRCELGNEVVTCCYLDRRGRDRRVRYWSMRPMSGSFRPNREVDAFRWLEPTDAFDVLSYEHDRGVLEAFRFPLDRSRLAAS
jgi:8-oxo-dGTP pyrophosphatase MutT (NUDIX family)